MSADSDPASAAAAASGDTSSARTASSAKSAAAAVRAAPGPPRFGWGNTLVSLYDRDFRYLWFGVLFMMGGVNMQMLARGYLVYELTGSARLLGLVSAGSALPILGLALFGGAIADRWERKRVIQACQAIMMAVTLIVAVAIANDRVTWVHLLVAATVQGALWSFLMPARQAIIPQLVGKDKLTNALALNAAAMSATTLVTPAVAGNLYRLIGPEGIYYVVASFNLVSVVMTGLIRPTDTGPAQPNVPMLGQIKEGLAYIKRSPLVLVLLFMGLATTLLAMPFRFLIPVFVVAVYDRGPEAYGVMLSVMGLGSLVGTMVIASLGAWRRGLLLLGGSLVSGAALLLIGLVPYYAAAVGFMLFLGLGDATRRALNQTLILEDVEDQYRGRVMSVFMMNFGLMPLGVWPAGLAIDLIGGPATVAILGLAVLATTTALLVTQKRLRELQ